MECPSRPPCICRRNSPRIRSDMCANHPRVPCGYGGLARFRRGTIRANQDMRQVQSGRCREVCPVSGLAGAVWRVVRYHGSDGSTMRHTQHTVHHTPHKIPPGNGSAQKNLDVLACGNPLWHESLPFGPHGGVPGSLRCDSLFGAYCRYVAEPWGTGAMHAISRINTSLCMDRCKRGCYTVCNIDVSYDQLTNNAGTTHRHPDLAVDVQCRMSCCHSRDAAMPVPTTPDRCMLRIISIASSSRRLCRLVMW